MGKKEFVQGRSNLAVTAYVPWDCSNNCSFCTSKQEYSCVKDFVEIQRLLQKVNDSPIQDVVITGGEPTESISGLSIMLDCVPNKDVYINTTMIKSTETCFADLVNHRKNVKGVNISRHSDRYSKEELNNISEDYCIGYIKPPVHINVVSPERKDISSIIIRYREIVDIRQACDFGDLTICIREDFRKTTKESLHSSDNYMLSCIGNMGFKLVSHKFCNVCDTYKFKINDGYYISYHRGLETTSIELDNRNIEVNDIVIYPDGTLCYDWDKEKICDESIFNEIKKPFCVPAPTLAPFTWPMNGVNQLTYCNCTSSDDIRSCGCSMGCGSGGC